MKAKFVSVLLAASVLAGAGIWVGGADASAETALPLVYEAAGKLTESERLTYTPAEDKGGSGNALSVKVFLKNTYNYGFPASFSVTSGDREYTWSKTVGTAAGIRYEGVDGTAGKSAEALQWNSMGFLEIPYLFYGEIILPFADLENGAGAEITSVSEFSVGITASVNSNFASGDTWTADGISLYLFDVSCVTLDDDGNPSGYEEIADFCGADADDVRLSADAENAEPEGALRTATEEDYAVFEAFNAAYYAACDTRGDMKIIEDFEADEAFSDIGAERVASELHDKFYLSGQLSDYSVAAGGVEGNALHYNLDSSVYDAGKNSYAGVHFNFAREDATDWSGAKGITVYVENTADYLVSFALEIFQYNLETGLLEQYNLNDVGQKYKTVYAYNVETGEEFSYHTQTFTRVPAGFKGWIRIPFSQYAAPAWSTSPTYGNEGVLDFDKNPVVKISVTRLFNANQDTEIILDDIALYYSDFGVGSLFDDSRPSIRECIESGSIA